MEPPPLFITISKRGGLSIKNSIDVDLFATKLFKFSQNLAKIMDLGEIP